MRTKKEYRVDFNITTNRYSLQEKHKFLFFNIWLTIESSHDFDYIENKYSELQKIEDEKWKQDKN